MYYKFWSSILAGGYQTFNRHGIKYQRGYQRDLTVHGNYCTTVIVSCIITFSFILRFYRVSMDSTDYNKIKTKKQCNFNYPVLPDRRSVNCGSVDEFFFMADSGI